MGDAHPKGGFGGLLSEKEPLGYSWNILNVRVGYLIPLKRKKRIKLGLRVRRVLDRSSPALSIE